MVGINKTKMKKIYVSLLFIGLVISSAVAQSNSAPHRLKTVNHVSDVTVKPVTNHYAKSVLWTEDFAGGLNSTNGTWTVGGTNGDIWKHSFFKSSGEWSSGTNPMASTTEANGYMLFDADSVNFPVSPNYINLTGELISPTIDLSGATSALLEFQQDFRFCCAGSHDITVSVSNDGGATWGPASNVTNGTPTNDDFYGSNGDSYVFQLNISTAAADNSNVKLKFTWDGNASGTSHYYWTIDDINISTLPDHDLVALSSWVVGSTNDGIEYGKTPEDQADANWIVGTEVYNFGANVETNVTLDADFGGFTSQTIEASFGLDTTIFMQSTEALTLTPAVYNGTYTVTSDDETAASPLFGNNTRTREFEITAASTNPGSIYAQDGIDVYANPILSSLGTVWMSYAESQNCSEKLKFIGPLEWGELTPHYQNSDAFVLFSDYESFSIVIAEAWSTGTPVISTSVGIASNLEEKFGIQVQKQDLQSLKTAMLSIINGEKVFDPVQIVSKAAEYNAATILKKWTKLIKKHVR